MVQQDLGKLMKINGYEVYKYPEINLSMNFGKLLLHRYLHIAAKQELYYAKQVFTLVENYEKTRQEKIKPAIVLPIIFYGGDVPLSVYNYVMQAPIIGGKYGQNALFCLPAIANEEAIFIKPPAPFSDGGIPQRVKEVVTIEDILSAGVSLVQSHGNLENIIVPEKKIAPNLTTNKALKYIITGLLLTVGSAGVTGAAVGASLAPAQATLLAIISALMLMGIIPVYKTFNRIEYQISKS